METWVSYDHKVHTVSTERPPLGRFATYLGWTAPFFAPIDREALPADWKDEVDRPLQPRRCPSR